MKFGNRQFPEYNRRYFPQAEYLCHLCQFTVKSLIDKFTQGDFTQRSFVRERNLQVAQPSAKST